MAAVVGLASETFTAAGKVADEGSLAAVCSEMLLERGRVCEALAAVGMRAAVRLLAAVNTLVSPQVGAVGKALSTRDALQWLLARVRPHVRF